MIGLSRIYTKRANTRRNFAEFSRELLLQNYTLVSTEAVYIKRESSPRIPREKNHLQNVARARANRFSCQHFIVNTCFLLKTFLSCLRIHCCLYNHLQENANSLANQCRRSSETNLDKLPREKKQTLARVLGESQCRCGFRLKYRVSMASAEGASKKFRVFWRTAAYEVIFSNSRGRASAPPPLRAPMFRILLVLRLFYCF